MTKKLYIKTYGCQMNAYDSVRMAELLAPMGYTQTDAPDHADMVILNTCHIREKAAEKVYSDLGRMRDIKQSRPEQKMLIGVAGCVAQAEGEEIIARAPYVDVVVGPQSYQNLPNMIRETLRSNKAAINLDFPEIPKFDQLTEATLTQGSSAFVSVQEGCDKFCTFCVVPYTRGAEYSRSVRDVLEETRKLVDLGAIEITLLGQNVNAYHGIGVDGKEWGLGKLIREVAKIKGVKRIRYTTSHPNDVNDELIAAHGDIEILMPMLHLPVQSGSNKILKAMNRKHTASDYLAAIEKLRAARPDIQFSSDFIVGFPGESDADFEDTLRLVETVGFTQGYSFKYSPRAGTPAAEKAQQLEEAVLDARLQTLQNLLSVQQANFNKSKLGTTLSVLFNREGRLERQMQGRSPYMQSVYVDNGIAYANRLVDVHITGAYANSLKGEVVGTSQLPNPQQERVAHYG